MSLAKNEFFPMMKRNAIYHVVVAKFFSESIYVSCFVINFVRWFPIFAISIQWLEFILLRWYLHFFNLFLVFHVKKICTLACDVSLKLAHLNIVLVLCHLIIYVMIKHLMHSNFVFIIAITILIPFFASILCCQKVLYSFTYFSL